MTMKVSRFFRSERGSYSVEAVIMFPLLLWALSATFVFWDVFKLRNNSVAATYTIADMVSRQTQAVDTSFVGGLDTLYRALLGENRPVDLRVTVFRMDPGPDPVTDPTELALVWSSGSTNLPAILDPAPLEDELPILAVGATLIMVESSVAWSPPLSGILPQLDLTNRVFASPRFVPQIDFDDGSGSLGGEGAPDDGD